VLLVKENEKIPADGVVLTAAQDANVDESMITGESRAVSKSTGDEVFGGSLNQNTPFEIRVSATGSDSFLSQVSELVRHAQSQKSHAEGLADRVAGYLFYAALVVGVAALIAWTLTDGFSAALLFAVSVFVIACPHALGLAVPLVVARLTNISAKNGLLIQNRTGLESIEKMKFALMDKTGTLTDGKFEVRHIGVAGNAGMDAGRAVEIMAALEVGSTHPLAQAIVTAAGKGGSRSDHLIATGVENLPGTGIRGVVDGRQYALVSSGYCDEHGIDVSILSVKQYQDLGLTVSYLVSDGLALGFVALGDSLKPDSKQFIAELKSRGIVPVMLTGDNRGTAQRIAASLGVEDFRAQLKPADKADIVKEYQSRGKVMFIGDGVNDSPALATADLGIAIGSGTSVAIHTADVVLVNSNPSSVIDLLDIAHKSNVKIKENLWWGAGYNVIAIPLAAGVLYPSLGVMIDPLVAAILMSLSTIIVALNALGLRYSHSLSRF
jgi:Cu2+-exporting ATPase